MSRAPAPGPDPLSLNISSADPHLQRKRQSSSKEDSSEADFAELANRIRARAQGLPPDLSADLALDIVLNEIVEQACLATGASGAAIALRRDGALVCRASSGSTAPGLGSRLDAEHGLSAEAIRTRRIQICDDAETDPHVDVIAARQLGVRSVIVLPLVHGPELIGLLEAFSARAAAFGERDQRTLETLARRSLENVERAANWIQTTREQGRALHSASEGRDWEASEGDGKFAVNPRLRSLAEAARLAEAEEVRGRDGQAIEPSIEPDVELAGDPMGEFVPPITPHRSIRALTWILGTIVAMSAIALAVLTWRRLEAGRPGAPSSAGVISPSPAASKTESMPPGPANSSAAASSQPSSTGAAMAPPAGSLQVFQDGKEVFRMTPGKDLAGGGTVAPRGTKTESNASKAASQPATSVQTQRTVPKALSPDDIVELPSGEAEQDLVRRVEPEYPPEARQQGIQGEVVLEVRIHADGSVQDVLPVRGQPLLSSAAITAVRQWRFRPHMVNGRAVEMQTRVTLDFRLPN